MGKIVNIFKFLNYQSKNKNKNLKMKRIRFLLKRQIKLHPHHKSLTTQVKQGKLYKLL